MVKMKLKSNLYIILSCFQKPMKEKNSESF